MDYKNTPSSVMYAQLKSLGVSNRQAASLLMNTRLTFDGLPLEARIAESSQLSRRIVHTVPGEIPRGLFNSFHVTCPRLARLLADKQAVERFKGDCDAALEWLKDEFAGMASEKMLDALEAQGIEGAVYRNMVAYIERADLPDEQDRLTLGLMMFVATGCLGSPKAASLLMLDYASDVLGVDFQTAQTVVSAAAQPAELQGDSLLGLVRLVDGCIKAGSHVHVLNPKGTEIGLLSKARHAITDVDPDVSRRHVLIWREACSDEAAAGADAGAGTRMEAGAGADAQGVNAGAGAFASARWLVKGLGSTNGTRLVSGATGAEVVVEPPRADRADGADYPPVEIAPTDVLCLGATTCFMVLPVLE